MPHPEVAAPTPRRPNWPIALAVTAMVEVNLCALAVVAVRTFAPGPAPTWLAAALSVLAAVIAFVPAAVVARLEERRR